MYAEKAAERSSEGIALFWEGASRRIKDCRDFCIATDPPASPCLVGAFSIGERANRWRPPR